MSGAIGVPMFRLVPLVVAAALAAACSKSDEAGDASDLATEQQKYGYALGVEVGKSLTVVKDEVELAALIAGVRETMDGKEPRLSEEQRAQIQAEMTKKFQQKRMEETLAKGKVAKEAGEKFLAENGKREGVKTTASGLQYEVLKEGAGAAPTARDRVQIHYRGTLVDGTEWDSTYSRGQPVTFPAGNVFPGWTEGLLLMKVGGKSKLYVPAQLAYGERGAGTKIGPNETVILEVELLGVEKMDAPKPAAPAKKK